MSKINEHDIKVINDNAMAAINRSLKELTFIERMLNENDYSASKDANQALGALTFLKSKIHEESEVKIRDYRKEETRIREEKEKQKEK